MEPVPEMMQAARSGEYAIGYFESWSIETLQGVIDAAETSRSPVIIGFNGEFLSRDGRLEPERLSVYAALAVAAAESAKVPCGLIFNECAQDDWVEEAVSLGFNLVMPADAHAPPDEYRGRVARLTAIAHEHGVAVEAELGELPYGNSGNGALTDPDEAAAFVETTEVDLLAVSAGNVHVKLEGRQALDLEHLQIIADKVNIPLVLHGGSGIDDESLKRAIHVGVTKINYGTCLKQTYLAALRSKLDTDQADPHELLGMGGDPDIMVAGRRAVRDEVLRRMNVIGCGSRA